MQRKKICGLLVCLLAFVATNAFGQYWGDVGDFEYTGDVGVITITGYNGSGGAIVIPDTIIGMPVVSIGNNAFREITTITSANIPEGIINIGASAFKDCTGLTSVSLPDSLEEIGASAFYGTGLTSVIIPELITVINSSVFYECIDLASVTMPEGILSIGTSAFRGCEALTSISLPDSLTTISGTAFKGCIALTSVDIPALVASLTNTAFAECSSLTSINVNAANATYSSVDGVVYDPLVENLIIFPAGKSGAFSIPAGVTEIGKLAFSGCSAITDVTIPEGLTTIFKQAFYLSSITSVNVPASLATIQAQAFRGCPNLTSITVDAANTVYTSVDGALYNIDGTTLIQCPGGLTGTFSVPSGVTTVLAHAFSEASALTSVTFSDTVSSINTAMAVDTPTMTSFVVDAANPTYSSLNGIIYNKDQTTLVLAPKGISGHFTIPDGVITLGDNSFGACELLTGVTIPDSVTTLAGSWMTGPFTRCTGLTSMTIPDSVTSIAGPSFYGCTSLTSMHIGSGATTTGSGLAWECTSLQSITVDPANTSFTSIDGVVYNKDATVLLYFPLGRAGTFTVPDGVTEIDSSALRAAHFITEITLPGSVTLLDRYSLSPMDSLTTVNMAEGLETIEKGALRYAPKLTGVTIPASVTEIANDAFLGNWRMSSAYFAGAAPEMGTNVFSGTAADFHVCYEWWSAGFDSPWNGYRAYPIFICDDPSGDFDTDGTENYLDNCVFEPNSDQSDVDADNRGDICDNCPDVSNYDQKVTCGDGTAGDACQPDIDGDAVPDTCDNCPDDINPLQGDVDDNGIGNICEEGSPCYYHVEISSDPYEATEVLDNDCDKDLDGVTNTEDNCPDVANPGQGNVDVATETGADILGDVCDADTVYGYVDVSGAAIEYVNVTVYRPNCGGDIELDSDTTDSDGYYSFGNLGVGYRTIVAELEGYTFVPEVDYPRMPQAEIKSFDFTATAD